MSNRSRQEDKTQTAIAAIAAASKTPFKTAFLAYMGIAAAQLLLLVVAVGIIGGSILMFTSMKG